MTVVESDPHCWGSGWNFEPCVCHVGNSCGCQSGWEWVLSPSRRKAEGRPFPCFSRHLCSPWGFLAWNIYGRFEVKVRTLWWFLWRCGCYPHCSPAMVNSPHIPQVLQSFPCGESHLWMGIADLHNWLALSPYVMMLLILPMSVQCGICWNEYGCGICWNEYGC